MAENVLIEVIGQPGSGKTTIIKHLESMGYESICYTSLYNNKSRKVSRYARIIKMYVKILERPFKLIYSLFYYLKTIKFYTSLNIYILFSKRLKKTFKIWLRYQAISKTHNVLIYEGLLHLISNKSKNVTFEDIIRLHLNAYGNPKYVIIYVDTPIKESMSRMSNRAGQAPMNIEKLTDSYNVVKSIHKKIIREINNNKNKYNNINIIKLDGNLSPKVNSCIIIDKLKKFNLIN